MVRLAAAKATTRELGIGVVDPAIRGWVEHEFDVATDEYERVPTVGVDKRAAAADAFRSLLTRWSTP